MRQYIIWYPRSKWDNTLFDIQDLMRQYIIWYPRSNETIHYLVLATKRLVNGKQGREYV